MKTTSKYIIRPIRQALTLCLLALAMAGCVKDDCNGSGTDCGGAEESNLITFDITVPTTATPDTDDLADGSDGDAPQTRSMTTVQEDQVKTVDILVFAPNGGNFDYHATAVGSEEIIPVGNDKNKYTFKVILKKTDACDIVILANASATVEAFLTAQGNTAFTKDDLQKGLIIDSDAGAPYLTSAKKWDSATPAPIPMWAEVTGRKIASNETIDGIKLHRMLARINVTNLVSSNFTLKEVYLYNPAKAGLLIPANDSWENGKAKDASWLTGWGRRNGYLLYKDAEIGSDGNCVREIYTFESKAGDGTGGTGNTFLVIGGEFDNTGKTTYYRIDFCTQDTPGGTITYLPLKRNHTYDITIKKVKGSGVLSPSDAAGYGPANMDAGVVVESDYDINYYGWNNQDYIGTEKRVVECEWHEVNTFSMRVKTNLEDGKWKAVASTREDDPTATTGAEWIKIQTPQTDNLLVFKVEDNDSENPRTGYIHLMCGDGLWLPIKVVQKEADYELKFYIAPDKDNITVGNGQGEYDAVVKTNYPYLWTAEVVGTNSSWLTINTGYETGTMAEEHLKFSIKANAGVERIAQIKVTAGRITETITVTQAKSYSLTVNPTSINVDWFGGLRQFMLTTDAPGWTIKISTDIENENAGVPAWMEVDRTSGSESMAMINVDILTNHSTASRQPAYIHVKAGDNTKQIISVTQTGTDITGGTYTPFDYTNKGYVGAFWRANQTGERLIRIASDVNSNITGIFTAEVLDVNGGRDWIILDTQMSTDGGIGWRGGNNPADMNTSDALYQVSGRATAVRGTATTGQALYFRIGLKSAYTPTADKPARYGVVRLYYGNNSKYSDIYIRQGHHADYLMRTSEPGTSMASRPLAAKYSPYNLTAEAYRNGSNGGGTDISHHVQLAVNGGVETHYPTQAGAYFQWADQSGNYAYHPTNPHGGITGWNPVSDYPGFWTSMTGNWAASRETCPPGYRRPKEGPTDAAIDNTTDPVRSEQRQSLWLNPSGTASSTNNLLWGYYADGFFDRWEITASPLTIQLQPYSTVCAGDYRIAYVGRLFCNPNNHASLFFPAAGSRRYETGALLDLAMEGSFCTASSYDASRIYFLYAPYVGITTQRYGSRSQGYSVRCVKENPNTLE